MNFTSLFSAPSATAPPDSTTYRRTHRNRPQQPATSQPDSAECSVMRYSIEMIRDEARQLVQQGKLSRYQPLYALCQYVPAREWVCVERILEENEFLLREQILDLLGREDWDND